MALPGYGGSAVTAARDRLLSDRDRLWRRRIEHVTSDDDVPDLAAPKERGGPGGDLTNQPEDHQAEPYSNVSETRS